MLNFNDFLILELKSSVIDIYAKYYQDIDKNIFDQIVKSDPSSVVVENQIKSKQFMNMSDKFCLDFLEKYSKKIFKIFESIGIDPNPLIQKYNQTRIYFILNKLKKPTIEKLSKLNKKDIIEVIDTDEIKKITSVTFIGKLIKNILDNKPILTDIPYEEFKNYLKNKTSESINNEIIEHYDMYNKDSLFLSYLMLSRVIKINDLNIDKIHSQYKLYFKVFNEILNNITPDLNELEKALSSVDKKMKTNLIINIIDSKSIMSFKQFG